jgi:hypothetical protein
MGIMGQSKLRPRASQEEAKEVMSIHAQAEKIFESRLGRKPKAREQVIGRTVTKPYFHVQRGEHENFLPDDDVFVVDVGTGVIQQRKWKDIITWPKQTFDSGAWRIFPPKTDGLISYE